MTGVSELPSLLDGAEVDALLITSPANVRYLSGFTSPEDGRVLVTASGARLITDARYDAQAAEESRLPLEIRRDWLPWVAAQVDGGRLGVEADELTLAHYQDLAEECSGTLVPLRRVLRDERAVKRDEEQARLRQAAKIGDEAFAHVLTVIRPGVREIDVALELEHYIRSNGAEAISFETIVASGARSAMAHGLASQKVIESGELVTLDFGAVVGGYHGDMTRAVAVGELDDDLRRMFDAVLEAQLAALEAITPGAHGREVDAVARASLERHDLDRYFSHSLGHGVGLQVHEPPGLSQRSEDVLQPGMAVTVEPGVYLAGRGGVRIEDLVLVTEDGYERLSLAPKELITI